MFGAENQCLLFRPIVASFALLPLPTGSDLPLMVPIQFLELLHQSPILVANHWPVSTILLVPVALGSVALLQQHLPPVLIEAHRHVRTMLLYQAVKIGPQPRVDLAQHEHASHRGAFEEATKEDVLGFSQEIGVLGDAVLACPQLSGVHQRQTCCVAGIKDGSSDVAFASPGAL